MNLDEAHDIVAAARKRGLGSRPQWRRWGSVLWASFIGACCSLIALLLAPSDWELPEWDMEQLSIVFGISWLLALIPALAASYTAPAVDRHGNDEK
jgi:hypothetical protein